MITTLNENGDYLIVCISEGVFTGDMVQIILSVVRGTYVMYALFSSIAVPTVSFISLICMERDGGA
jgi:hypothetical protein